MNTKYSIIVVLLLSLTNICNTQSNTIKFGASIHSKSEFYFDLKFVPTVLSTYKFFEHWVKENINLTIRGVEYDFEFVILGDARTGIDTNYIKLIEEDNVTIAVNLGSIISAEISGEVANERKFPLLVISPSPNVYKNKTTVFNIYPNPYSQLYDILPLLRVAGAKSIHVLDMSNSTKACYDNQLIFDLNFIEDVTTTVYSQYGDEFSEAVDKVIELDKDLLIYCNMNQTNYNELTRILYEKKYVPRAGLNLMLDKFDLNANYSDYWMMYNVLPDGINNPPTKYLKTFDDAKKEMQKFHKLYPEYKIDVDQWKENIVQILTKLELALDAVLNAESLEKSSLVDYIRRSKYDSLMGKISFSSDNTHLISGVGFQQINSTTKNILLPSTLSNASIIYPAPLYDERKKDDKFNAVEIAVYVVLFIFVLNSFAWMIYIVVNRKKNKLRSSSPIFLFGMLIGSILIYISLMIWSPKFISKSTCILLPWVLSCGFTILFGSMLVKTWRVHLLFSEKSLEVFKISNRKVLMFLSLLLLIDVVLLSLWSGLSKMKTKEIIVDDYRISKNYETCESQTAGKVLIWIIIGYKALMIVYGGYLALRVRTIPIKIYDESKIIAFCIYNVGLTSIIICALQATSPTGRFVIFGINSFLILLSTATTINSMMISKMKSIHFMSMTSTSGSASNGSKMSSSHDSSEMNSINVRPYDPEKEKLLKKIKSYKKEIKELKLALQRVTGNDEESTQ